MISTCFVVTRNDTIMTFVMSNNVQQNQSTKEHIKTHEVVTITYTLLYGNNRMF